MVELGVRDFAVIVLVVPAEKGVEVVGVDEDSVLFEHLSELIRGQESFVLPV